QATHHENTHQPHAPGVGRGPKAVNPVSRTEGDGARAARGGRTHFARLTKRASRVSTSTTSSDSRYAGTWITSPVSSVAGFVCAEAVAPFIAGAVSTTRRLTVFGRSIDRTRSLKTTERMPSRPSRM